MELFSAVILSCFVDANFEPLACRTYTHPDFQNTMEECLNTLALGIAAAESVGTVAIDYRCISWRKTGEDLPYNDDDT